jgi:hypothetical protein
LNANGTQLWSRTSEHSREKEGETVTKREGEREAERKKERENESYRVEDTARLTCCSFLPPILHAKTTRYTQIHCN